MLTFREMIESITIKDGELQFIYDDIASGVSTRLGKGKFTPRTSSIKSFDGNTVYTVYNTMTHATAILKALKKQSSTSINAADYDKFLTRTAIFIAGRVSAMLTDIDVIIVPQSSSFLLHDILGKVHNIMPGVKIVFNTFVKGDVDKIVIDYADFNVSSATKTRMAKLIQNAKQEGFIEVKKVPKRFLKYISHVLEIDKMVVRPDYIEGKNIAIFDDVLSSGFTMTEMFRLMKFFSPKSLRGITLFKT